MSALSEFYLSGPSSVRPLDLLEITHPNFTQDYFLVRNCRGGVTVTLEDSTVQYFQYYPMLIKGIAANQTLDQILEVQIGDLGEVLSKERRAVEAADGFRIKPVCKHRVYRSDYLLAPMYGPIVLEIGHTGYNWEGSAFQAKAPIVNANKTGELYTFERFEMLRGFL